MQFTFYKKSSFAWQKINLLLAKKDFICWLTTIVTQNIRMPVRDWAMKLALSPVKSLKH